jgi:hypothetical protein
MTPDCTRSLHAARATSAATAAFATATTTTTTTTTAPAPAWLYRSEAFAEDLPGWGDEVDTPPARRLFRRRCAQAARRVTTLMRGVARLSTVAV